MGRRRKREFLPTCFYFPLFFFFLNKKFSWLSFPFSTFTSAARPWPPSPPTWVFLFCLVQVENKKEKEKTKRKKKKLNRSLVGRAGWVQFSAAVCGGLTIVRMWLFHLRFPFPPVRPPCCLVISVSDWAILVDNLMAF